ncbi:MAG: sialate O-acetylesterase [Planctomycetes bacterium]|nr:sialate O-acetylesterase [Planctomycetota bacterium]
MRIALRTVFLGAAILCAVAPTQQAPSVTAEQTTATAEARPVKVFILLGQSNMVGFGRVGPADVEGSLAWYCEQEGKYPELRRDDGSWVVRDDVWCVKTTVGQRQGWLEPGFGARPQFFGPELGFGEVLGDLLDEPVLIIKASQGNRSLGWDILPPGSERFEFQGRTYAGYRDTPDSWVEGEEKKAVDWYAGKQYDDFVRDIHEVLNDLRRFYPDYAGQGYEIAGFAWWQGHKDQNAAHASRYEQNLVRLIQCLREEFEAPNAPFAIATIAFGGMGLKGHGLTVLEAQLAVSGETGKYPEFEGNVKTVDARPFWHAREGSPSNQDYHYFHNAETYLEVGRALGRAMAEMLPQRARGSQSGRRVRR